MQGRLLAAAAVLLVLATAPAFGDGAVFSLATDPSFLTTGPRSDGPVPVDPVIPDQRALIFHDGAREMLVIETEFTGAGTDFAWVVPTPTVPKIATAPSELFPRLDGATQPSLISETPDLKYAGLFLVASFLAARHFGRRGRRVAGAAVGGAALVLAIVGTVGVPSSAPHGHGKSMLTIGASVTDSLSLPMTPAEELVAVRQREVVGVMDAVTLEARDAGALVRWLTANGYSVAPGLESVAAGYVRDGWVFNAVRLRRDAGGAGGAETVRIHPVAFAFDVAAPVYPMRLTGVRGTPVNVELFVAGAARATSDGFTVNRCARIDREGRHSDDAGRVVLGEEWIRDLIPDAQVLTRLDRRFTPEEMTKDSAVGWTDFEAEQPTVFSKTAASAFAWNAGCVVAIAALVGLASAGTGPARRIRRPSAIRRMTTSALILVVALDAGLAVTAVLPTVETRPASGQR